MKVIIPLDEDKKSVCVAFGRTPWFLVCDLETKETAVIENPGAQAESGAGIKAAQAVVDSGAEVLITPRCGENAAGIFAVAEIKIYQSQGNDAMENVSAFADGKLQQLTHFHGGYHGIR